MAEKFVKAVAKPSRPDMNPIRYCITVILGNVTRVLTSTLKHLRKAYIRTMLDTHYESLLCLFPNRVKEVYRLEEMEKIFVRYTSAQLKVNQVKFQDNVLLLGIFHLFFSRLEMKVTKSSGGVPRLSYTGRDDRHFLPTGLYIIKTFNGKYS